MAYQYFAPSIPSQNAMLLREDNNLSIPCDLANQDYQAFLTWIAEGNTAPTGWTGPTNPTASPPAEGSTA